MGFVVMALELGKRKGGLEKDPPSILQSRTGSSVSLRLQLPRRPPKLRVGQCPASVAPVGLCTQVVGVDGV